MAKRKHFVASHQVALISTDLGGGSVIIQNQPPPNDFKDFKDPGRPITLAAELQKILCAEKSADFIQKLESLCGEGKRFKKTYMDGKNVVVVSQDDATTHIYPRQITNAVSR